MGGSSVDLYKDAGKDLAPSLDTDFRAPHGAIATELSRQELEQEDSHGVAKGTYAEELAATPQSAGWFKFLAWEGGTFFDAFFTCASAQVGQVILSLPHSLWQTGMIAGIFMMLGFASLAMWTVYLMVVLYLDNKNRRIKNGTWYTDDKNTRKTANQYHEVMEAATYKWLGIFSRVVVIIALGGLAVAQIIASSSNFHRLVPGVDKRDWALVFGGVATLMILVPNFRNARIFSFVALVATTFTAWYMVALGIIGSNNNGLQSTAWTNEKPPSLSEFFAGASNIIFTFGGHAMLLEVMDSMFRPFKFHKTFYVSYSYVFTLVLPNSVFIYWGWPAEAAEYGNVYAYMPRSVARDISIVLMVAHQVIVFGLFSFPLYFMAEKAINVHHGPYWKRVAIRLPIALLLWLIALAFPFFGVINDLLGAFTTTFETFIIPCLAYNIHYQLKKDAARNREESTKPPSKFLNKIGGWNFIFYFNWVIIIFTAVFGFGFGGYASVKAFVDSIDAFGVFAACFNC